MLMHTVFLNLQISAWRKIYENDMFKLLSDNGVTLTDDIKALVQGAEVAIWSEQVTLNL